MQNSNRQQRRRQRIVIALIVVCIVLLIGIARSYSNAAAFPRTAPGSTTSVAVKPTDTAMQVASSVASSAVTVLTEKQAPAVTVKTKATVAKPVNTARLAEAQTARSFFSIFGKPKEGQVLMYTNGRMRWRDLAYETVIENLTEGSVNISGYGRKPYKYPIDASSVLHSAAGGQTSPDRHYGGGGGRDTSTTSSTTVNNYYTTNTTTGGTGSLATFIGTTPLTTYTGLFTSSSKTGYDAGNAICAAAYTGSHFCRTDEILQTIATKDISTLFSGVPDAWIAEGPPGYTADSNDCRGWTSANLAHLGPWWDFNTSGGGIGYLTNCSTTKPLACCKAQ